MNKWQSKMQRFFFNYLATALCVLLLFSCAKSIHPKGDFFALVISDTHVSNDESKIYRLNWLIEKINTRKIPAVDLVFITGDVVSSVYSEYPDTADNRLQKAVITLSKLNVPFLMAMGNHDYKISRNRDSDVYFPRDELRQMEKIWKKYTGFDPYYSYLHKGWKFIILNSMYARDEHRAFGAGQLEWLQKQLKEPLPTVLFLHHPLETDNLRIWCKPNDLITERIEPEFYRLLEIHSPMIKGVFVGHGHRWINDTLFDSIKVFESESFGDESEPVAYVVGFDRSRLNIEVAHDVLPIYE